MYEGKVLRILKVQYVFENLSRSFHMSVTMYHYIS